MDAEFQVGRFMVMNIMFLDNKKHTKAHPVDGIRTRYLSMLPVKESVHLQVSLPLQSLVVSVCITCFNNR
jgi:hypothetical protein